MTLPEASCMAETDLINRRRCVARNLRLPAARRKDIRIDLRPTEQRDNSTDLYALGRGYYGAIDWLFAPTFYSPSSLKSGKAGTLTRSRRKSHECALAAMEFRLKGES